MNFILTDYGSPPPELADAERLDGLRVVASARLAVRSAYEHEGGGVPPPESDDCTCSSGRAAACAGAVAPPTGHFGWWVAS